MRCFLSRRALWLSCPWAVFLLAVMASCTGNKVYDQYADTPMAGWEKNDTLVFHVPKMQQDGLYGRDLLLRISPNYPFMSLTLIVEQTVWPSHNVRTDTLKCRLIDSNGRTYGQGLSYYQYAIPMNDVSLKQGDSLLIAVRHDMKREILPGVSNVGMQFTRR